MNDENISTVLRDLKGKVDEISESLGAVIGSNDQESSKSLVYEERRHFEGLLKDRISLQLVFSSLFLFAVYRGVNDPNLLLTIPILGEVSLQQVLLVTGAVVSMTLLQAVFRTYRFVKCALDEIERRWKTTDPYPRYRDKAWLWDANHSLLFASITLTGLFVLLAACGVPDS
jgi:hypothetical protein